MVTVTDQAATAIRMLIANPEVPAGAGLRITGDQSHGDDLELALEPAPGADDTVVDSDGVLLFLDPTAAAVLDHKALDAYGDEDGGLQFVVANHPRPAASNGERLYPHSR
jgi:Fe-S cluster assembly iron-binding protein IscA